jgi:septal ring factor EnvC (AmiA/AmiB activator)
VIGTRAVVCLVALALALALVLAPRAAPADDAHQRLEKLRLEIEQREASARALAAEAQGELAQLEGIDRELAELRRSLRKLRAREREASVELAETDAGVEQAAVSLHAVERDLSRRLVALYKFTATGGHVALASAGDLESRARKRHGLARIVDQDRLLFERHRQARETWSAARARSRSLLEEIRAARREVSRREEAARRKLVERRNLVALLRSRADRETRTAGELRHAAQRLEEAIAELPRGGPFEGRGLRRGMLAPPVQGAVRLPFGRQVDPEFGTQTVRNGIEIEAPLGASVRAVADARVLFAGWFRGYGQMVILDHGRGDLTVCAHLEELSAEKGEVVRSGQEIGTVGQTGSLSEPGLYFELRDDGKPVDPRPWLGL